MINLLWFWKHAPKLWYLFLVLSSLRFARPYANLWQGCSASKWSRTLAVSHLHIRTVLGSSVSAFITLWFSKLHPTFRRWLHTSPLPSESFPVGSTHWCVKPNLSTKWSPFKCLTHFHASEWYPCWQGVFGPRCAGFVTACMRSSLAPSLPAHISAHPPHACTLC